MPRVFDPLRQLVLPDLAQMMQDGADETRLILAVTAMLARDAGPALASIPHGHPRIPSCVARVVFDLLAIEALVVPSDRIEEGLRWQYPDLCRVCEHKPCQCTLARPPDRRDTAQSHLGKLPTSETPTTLQGWQTFFANLYPNEGVRTGEIVTRLASEAHEACATALDHLLLRHKSEVVIELAQVFAWLCAFATQREISFDYAPHAPRQNFNLWRDDLRALIT